MTVMTQEQEAVLRELVLLAQGNSDLVWEAIHAKTKDDQVAPLDDVVEYIVERVRANRGLPRAGEQKASVR